MDAVTLIKIFLRRWYVILPMVLISLFFAVRLYGSGVATYSSTYRVIVLPPSTQTIPAQQQQTGERKVGVNPYASAGGAGLLVQVLQARLNQRDGPFADVNAKVGVTAPMVTISVTRSSAEATNRAMSAIRQSMPSVVRDLQTGVGAPASFLYEAHELGPPSSPAVLFSRKSKAAIAVLAAGGLLAALLAVFADALASALTRRRARTSLRRSASLDSKSNVDHVQQNGMSPAKPARPFEPQHAPGSHPRGDFFPVETQGRDAGN